MSKRHLTTPCEQGKVFNHWSYKLVLWHSRNAYENKVFNIFNFVFFKSNLNIDCKNHTEIQCFDIYFIVKTLTKENPLNIVDEEEDQIYPTQSTSCCPLPTQHYIHHICFFTLWFFFYWYRIRTWCCRIRHSLSFLFFEEVLDISCVYSRDVTLFPVVTFGPLFCFCFLTPTPHTIFL